MWRKEANKNKTHSLNSINRKMKRIQNIFIVIALLTMTFSGCLGNDDNDDKNTAPEALIMMPRQADVVEAGKPFIIDGSASKDADGDELQYLSLIHI